MSFEDNIVVNLTSYLQNNRDKSIKKILDMLDMSDISPDHKQKIRKTILDEINDFYLVSCRTLTYFQEKNGCSSKT